MFAEEPKKPKIRKFTPQEWETEKQVADAFRRPPCSFFGDKPFYPYCVPEPVVNFRLNYCD